MLDIDLLVAEKQKEKQKQEESQMDDFNAILSMLSAKEEMKSAVQQQSKIKEKTKESNMKVLDKKVKSTYKVEGEDNKPDISQITKAEDVDFNARREKALKLEEKERLKAEKLAEKERKKAEKAAAKGTNKGLFKKKNKSEGTDADGIK